MVDFRGGPMVKNPPANAGGTGSILGLRRSHVTCGNLARAPQLTEARMPRAWELQLLKPVHPRACARQQEKPPQREAHASQPRGAPALVVTRASLCAATKAQRNHWQITKQTNKTNLNASIDQSILMLLVSLPMVQKNDFHIWETVMGNQEVLKIWAATKREKS